jgi:hypothetical protein
MKKLEILIMTLVWLFGLYAGTFLGKTIYGYAYKNEVLTLRGDLEECRFNLLDIKMKL